jgi:SAM-dependent methyltransferase
MQLVANQLARYYDTPAGAAACRAIADRMDAFWPRVKGLRLLGYGYAHPYMTRFSSEAERAVLLAPAQLGLPAATSKGLALGQEDALPFADSFFDRIVMVHGLEGAESARTLLRQLWRILAPEGRMIVVAPNRVSLWALAESSPFACGRPYRKTELDQLLRDTLFDPVAWDRALFLPPRLIGNPRTVRWRERMGSRVFSCLAGVHVVEAKKTLYGMTPLRDVKQRHALLVGA